MVVKIIGYLELIGTMEQLVQGFFIVSTCPARLKLRPQFTVQLVHGREEVWQILWYTMCNDARNLFEKRRGTSIKMPFAGSARRKCESVTFNWNTRYLTDEV